MKTKESNFNSTMLLAVSDADVIVTNGDIFAAVISYREKEMKAPIVVAKGKGLIAERIKNCGCQNNIPVIEDRSLALNLYYEAKWGQLIPKKFFKAIAVLLARSYRIKKSN